MESTQALQMTSTLFTRTRPSRGPLRRRWLACVLALGMLLLILPTSGWSQQCSSSSFQVDFGTLSNSGSTSVTAELPYNCQSNQANTFFNLCLFIPGGNQADTSGINPRRMTNYNNSTLNYNLYSDPAFTQIIGPPPAGTGYPIYTWSFMVPGGYTSPARAANIYGLVPQPPSGTAAGGYQAQMSGITIQYAWSNTTTPASCFPSGDAKGCTTGVGYSGTLANVSNACSISLGSISTLDFGSHASVAQGQNSTTTVSVNCPSNTSWRMGMSNGSNPATGQRRMRSNGGAYINYELYRDSARSQRWGNDTAGGSDTVNGSGAAQSNPTVINVYGRVPPQTQVPPGDYSDTVTVRLEY